MTFGEHLSADALSRLVTTLTISPAFDPQGQPRKPGALCIGAQKAGTSWLAQMLGQPAAVSYTHLTLPTTPYV